MTNPTSELTDTAHDTQPTENMARIAESILKEIQDRSKRYYPKNPPYKLHVSDEIGSARLEAGPYALVLTPQNRHRHSISIVDIANEDAIYERQDVELDGIHMAAVKFEKLVHEQKNRENYSKPSRRSALKTLLAFAAGAGAGALGTHLAKESHDETPSQLPPSP